VRFLLDTHLLLWAANDMLPQEAVPYFADEDNELLFSSASIWEIIIKRGLNRPDFLADKIVSQYSPVIYIKSNGKNERNIN